MTKEQRSITSAFVISVLVGGAYLVSWLAHVWGDQPWPIGSNMVNYAVVLVLFGVSLLLLETALGRSATFLPAFCRKNVALCGLVTRVCRVAARQRPLWYLRW